MLKPVDFLNIAKDSFRDLKKNDPLRLASSTAYFTLFALPPILIILTTILGSVFGKGTIKGEVFEKLKQLIGSQGADQVSTIYENIVELEKSWVITIGGSLLLIFIATTLFMVIQNSLNQLWQIKQKPKSNIRRVLIDRAVSFGLILVAGILVLASVISDIVIAFLSEFVTEWIFALDFFLLKAINYSLTIAILTTFFAMIFKYLPAISINWKPVWIGAFATAILFMAGKYILEILLLNSNIGNIYGASGSVVLVLLFVFYSSLIFYYGALIVKHYAKHTHQKVKPSSYAVRYKIVEE